MAHGDTPSINTTQDIKLFAHPAEAQEKGHDKAAVHHSLVSDAYNFVITHKKDTEVAIVTAAIGATALALRHYMPASVAEKITASGASILERTLGIAKTPNAMLEMKVLDAPEKVESLIAELRANKVTSDVLEVTDPRSGADIKLLTGHSPIAPEATTGADRIATCDLPAGCQSKGIFAQQNGPIFLNFDKARQTLGLSETPEPFLQRIGRFLKGDTEAWVPLGTQPSNDLRALQADRAIMPNLEHVAAAKETTANPAQEVVAKWESQQRAINRNADSQDYMSNLIRNDVLPDLKKQGLIDQQWRFFSTQISSASDRGGADAIFVHEGTGQAHFIDYSGTEAKRIRPAGESPNVRRAGIRERTMTEDKEFSEDIAGLMRDKNIAKVKTQGLIGFNDRWFDSMGRLDVENPDAAIFKKDLATQLTDLTHAPAFFTAGKTPFPDIVQATPATQIKQLETLKEWSLKEAAKPDSLHPEGYRDYAVSIDKSIGYLKAVFIEVGDTKHFSTVVQRAADQTIFRWAVDKVGASVAAEERTAATGVTTHLGAVHRGEALRFVPEIGALRFQHEGLTYVSDALTGQNGVLDKSRLALLQDGRIKQMFDAMSNKQKAGLLARLGSAGRPATEERAIREINSVLINHGNEIKAGGQLGVPQKGTLPPLVQRIHDRVQIHSVSTLTRPLDIPASAAKLDQ